MRRPTPEQISAAFDLGGPQRGTREYGGAHSNDVRHLRTARGDYVVKVFDPTIDHVRADGFRARLSEAIDIELAAIDAGIPAPRPIPAVTGGLLADIGGAFVRVHEHAPGRPVNGHPDAPFSRRIGRVLAGLHALPIACPHDEPAGLWSTHEDTHIAELATRAENAGHAWASALEAARGPWRHVRELAEERRTRTWPLVSTHRDLGPKNVLRTAAGTPIVVDWDVAGPWTAIEELAAATVEWAGVENGEPERRATDALIEGYLEGGGTIDVTGPEVFASWLVKQANWTEMHIRHALDPDAPRRELSRAAVPGLIAELVRYTTGVEEWARRLSG